MRLVILGIIGRALMLAVLFGAARADAHEQWANADIVPPWVKSSCCGPDDVHHLDKGQVRAMADGWHIDGLKVILPYGKELPSQDGDYWVFYKQFPDGTQSPVFCFFAPAQSF